MKQRSIVYIGIVIGLITICFWVLDMLGVIRPTANVRYSVTAVNVILYVCFVIWPLIGFLRNKLRYGRWTYVLKK